MIARFFLLLFFFLFFLPHQSFALENFSTAYNVTYAVAETGNTHVTFNVALTNTSSDYYASSYKVLLGFDSITNVTASDPDGKITPTVRDVEKGKEVQLYFNSRVVGKDNTLPFTLQFDTSDVATKQGLVWEINIPGLSNQDDFDKFVVTVAVPPSFGEPSYIKPKQATNHLTFTKQQLGKSGISLSFGDKQVYSYVLKYHITNKNLFPVRTEIALPPSTNYQTVYIDSLTPAPITVTIDPSGNWLAEYHLAPSQKLDITAKGDAEVFLHPKKQPLRSDEKKRYLTNQEYWEVSNSHIQELALKLKTPYAIYRYIVETLRYDYSRVERNDPRLGARKALENPRSAVCLEFTDVFIALARAAGIPAREVDGFAYTENERLRPLSRVKDILHAWPEYYDEEKQTWIMIDPTWGNTTAGIDYFDTLDLDHFAFVIKGEDSKYPIPAGGYKLEGAKETRDVAVDFSLKPPKGTPVLELTANIPESVPSALPITGTITAKNIGKTISTTDIALVQTTGLTPKEQRVTFAKIPPYGSITKSVYFDQAPILTKQDFPVTIAVGEKRIVTTLSVYPFFISKWTFIGGGLFVISSIIISIIAARTRRVPVPRQEQ